jgi:large conductance mechanosensitive channel
MVSDILMPPLGLILGRMDFAGLALHLNEKTAIRYGAFISTVVDFVIVAFAIFLIIRQINRFKATPPPPDPTSKDCPKCCSSIPLRATRCPHCTSEIAAR